VIGDGPAGVPVGVPQSGIGPGHPACWSLLAAATGLDEDAVLAGLRRGVDVALIDNKADGFRFRHALVRDAVLASMPAPHVMRLAATTRAAVERAHPGRPPRKKPGPSSPPGAPPEHDQQKRRKHESYLHPDD
jgi:hypothetical protein